ncbi:MAG: hypothetical protein ACREKQ_16305 [Candidatus Rokuibacteriota bacterium]
MRLSLGFDAVWFVEHHFLTSFSMSPCPEVIFGALKQKRRAPLVLSLALPP